ncbi:hypothetical protein B296_00032604 [Ensete ventricosum]|uniref:Uncharacterized protein n=1 Tax=Ensete ventricosum TaxID=4639 RepID=A0A427AD76_ENSVE|nr:hypothetical protein B296_00032604 [Ensete ventricosum]
MGASPVETAAQDANGHVIAEEANPAEMPGLACQDAGANVGHAEEGEQEAAAEDDLQGVFVYVASTAVGLALAYIQKVEASEEAVEVQTAWGVVAGYQAGFAEASEVVGTTDVLSLHEPRDAEVVPLAGAGFGDEH